MGKKDSVPDAWEDDWETQADRQEKEPDVTPPSPAKPLTQRERLLQHAERNRRLWEEAQAPETNHFVEANSNIPLTSTFKPQVKVLSRKPTPSIARRDPVTGALSQLSLRDDDDEEDDKDKPVPLTPEEIRAKQQREREEKQRRYDEVRAKIFGESAPSSGASSPGAVTPPRTGSGSGQRGRGRGRGRGGQSGGGVRSQQYQNQQQQQPAENFRRPAGGIESRGLYDPNASTRPGRRGADSAPGSGRTSPREQDVARPAIRAPRGPDSSGRGGFGFARRGGSGGD